MNKNLQNGDNNICDNKDIKTTPSPKPLLKEDSMKNVDDYTIIGGTMNNVEPECFFCGVKSSTEVELKPCQYCNDVYYCGERHFEYHRPESQCFPFIIKHAPGFGR